MVDPATAPYAILLLRLSLGLMFLAHATLKWKVFTIPGTIKYFRSIGLPGWLAYVTLAIEFGGGFALIVGLAPRLVALLLVPLLLGTIVTVHGRNGWLFTNKDGGWEYPAFWIVGLLVLAALGDGAAAIGPMIGLNL
jgi:putative oxidoreductase